MVRTRFAPSPTGYLHIGGVRTALYNWLFARQQKGQFILRIDDTDQQRNLETALEPILAGFRWLGLDWDEGPDVDGDFGPYYQSQRNDLYQAAIEHLLSSGRAYRDFATTDEIAAERSAAEKDKCPFVYSRNWAASTSDEVSRFESEDRQAVVRLKMPRAGHCEFVDHIRGPMHFEWQQEQDHVIQRADGSCLYHLASVVDDHHMQISHVIRAEEHLSNTPRQIFIAQSLDYPLPEFAHLPYVAEPGGKSKISKRKLEKYLKNQDFKNLFQHGQEIVLQLGAAADHASMDTFNPVIVDFYEQIGFLPEALVNYLLLLGWALDDKTEYFNRDEMIRHFSLERVNSAPASFDPGKLLSFQQHWMGNLPIKQKVASSLRFVQQAGWVDSPTPCDVGPKLTRILEAAGDRIKMNGDILGFAEFFVADDDLIFDEKAFDKRIRKPAEAGGLLEKITTQLAQVDPFDVEPLESMLHAFVEAEGIKIGQIIHALRVAVTGKSVGLGMFDTLALLGREACNRRIARALEQL